MSELTEKLRSYSPTSGYSSTMRRAADEIDDLKSKLDVNVLARLIYQISHREMRMTHERAVQAASNYVNKANAGH